MNAIRNSLGLAIGPFLWKEWRDHRVPLIAMVLAAPLLVATFALVAPARFTIDSSLPTLAAAIAFTVVSLALCGEVFAGEERRGTFPFLRRQPSGWWPPFLAKYVFLVLALCGVTAWSWGIAVLATWVCSGVAQTGLGAKNLETAILMFLLVPLWATTVSIWFPRSVIALPAAATVLLLFASPIVLACAFHDGLLEYLPPRLSDRALASLLCLLVGAAPIVALFSFARGRAVERGPWRAGVVGALATLVLFSPAYAWTTSRVVDFLRVEPGAPSFRIDVTGCLATNGRFAYVNAFQAFNDSAEDGVRTSCPIRLDRDAKSGDGPYHALRIDLSDGSWREFAPAGARVFPAPSGMWSGRTPFVAVQDPSAQTRPPRSVPTGRGLSEEWPVLPLFHADSGELLRPDIDVSFLLARDEAGARQQEQSNFLVLPDGDRAWFDHGRLVRSKAGGTPRVLPDSALEPDQLSIGAQDLYGHGAHLGRWVYYDVVRERRFEVPDRFFVRWIRSGGAIVREFASKSPSLDRPWLRWDPDARTTMPIVGLDTDAGVVEIADEMADDGRLFVGRSTSPKQPRVLTRLFLLDSDTGVREELSLPACLGGSMAGISLRMRTPTGVPVMSFWSTRPGGAGRDGFRFARFDLAARQFDVAASDVDAPLSLVGCDSEDSILVTDGRRLLRAWFGRPGVEVVFPKSDG